MLAVCPLTVPPPEFNVAPRPRPEVRRACRHRLRRFLVTGAGGCIGAWALRLLLDEGVPVVATDLSPDLRRFELISQGGLAASPTSPRST